MQVCVECVRTSGYACLYIAHRAPALSLSLHLSGMPSCLAPSFFFIFFLLPPQVIVGSNTIATAQGMCAQILGSAGAP